MSKCRWYGLGQQSKYQYEAESGHADYTRRATEVIPKGCLAHAARSVEKSNCIKKAVSEYRLKVRDNDREYRDLVAQQTSALWTGIMGIAALIGIALSALGVALVWTTFQETKRTNLIAMRENARNTRRAVANGKETAHDLKVAEINANASKAQVNIAEKRALAETRPHLGVRRIEIQQLRIGPDQAYTNEPGKNMVHIDTLVCVENFGRGIAINVSLGIKLRAMHDDALASSESWTQSMAIFPGNSENIEIWKFCPYEDVFPNFPDNFYIEIMIQYHVNGRKRPFVLSESWRVGEEIFRGTMQSLRRTHEDYGVFNAVAQRTHTPVKEHLPKT